MKRIALVAVMLVAAVVAHAAEGPADRGAFLGQLGSGVPVKGIYRTDSTARYLTTDGSGNLLTYSMGGTPLVRAGTTPIIDDTTAVGGADSSAVINVSAYKSIGLLIHVAGLGYARLAVQVRYCLNGQQDSSSVFPIALRADSVSTDGAAIGMAYGGTAVASPVQGNATISPYEFVVTLAEQSAVAAKWASPASACIPLLTRTGAYAFVNDIQVRIRMLGASSSAVGRVTAYLVASSL